MAVLVQKFGGTSVGTPQRLLDVSRRILEEKQRGWQVLVVVSAMGQTTDELVALAKAVSPHPPRREMDMLLTAGERISMALLAMALEARGAPAVSFTGSQSGIITDPRHSDARIVEIRPMRIEEALAEGRVVIVAGFQGVSPQKEITTLGRGGSDTTAVALAIRFASPWCEIFTDVHGVMSADPRIVAGARTIPRIGYEATIMLSHLGAQVLFRRSVILARKYRMPLRVRCALADGAETWIAAPDMEVPVDHPIPGKAVPPATPMETDRILSVACECSCALVEIEADGAAKGLVALLEEDGTAALWSWVETEAREGKARVRGVCADRPERLETIARRSSAAGARARVVRDLALVSLVGEGILDRPDLLGQALEILERLGIEVIMTRTAGLSASLLLPSARADDAVRALHSGLVTDPG